MAKFRKNRWAFGSMHRVPKPAQARKKELLFLLILLLAILYLGYHLMGDLHNKKKSDSANRPDGLSATEVAEETKQSEEEALAAARQKMQEKESWTDRIFRGMLSFAMPMGMYGREALCGTSQSNTEKRDAREKVPVELQTKPALPEVVSESKNAVLSAELQQKIAGGKEAIASPKGSDVLVEAAARLKAQTVMPFLERFRSAYGSAWPLGVSAEQLSQYAVMRNWYTTASNTSVTPEELRFETFLQQDFRLKEDVSGDYQILIYHTHSQEAFADSPSSAPEYSILSVGEELTRQLEAKGYRVLHLSQVFDVVDGRLYRSGAYGRAEPVITELLSEHPGIQVVLDIHRDGVGETVHLAQKIDGESVARIMIFNGICRDTAGPLPDVSNPYEQDNLAFGYQLRVAMETVAPGLCRTNYLKKGRYNLHMCPKSLLIEVGAQTNTLAEELRSMAYLAEALSLVLGS